MAQAGTKQRQLALTQRVKRMRPGAPFLETRARTILAAMVEDVTAGLESDMSATEGTAAVEEAEGAARGARRGKLK
jgi:hypothetical protein